MKTNTMLVLVIVTLVFGIGAYFLFGRASVTTVSSPEKEVAVPSSTPTTTPNPTNSPADNTTAESAERGPTTVIGTSAGGNPITAYHFGNGAKELLFIGGIHGGYSWNTAMVAYELIDHLTKTPALVPEDVTVTVIPVLNPDGLKATVGTTERFVSTAVPKDEAMRITGRFNENEVDLNRNFDCEWRAAGTWQNREVSGGSEAFSEPEAEALRAYVTSHWPAAVVAWYSAAGGVYASNCDGKSPEETADLVALYAKASGYTAYKDFNYYKVTGDMVNWFAKEDVPAISILLTTHENTEWSKNRAGIEAIIAHYAE